MNPHPLFSAGRLATSISRIGIRYGHTKTRYNPASGKQEFPPGHGEQIWVFNHIEKNHVVYSHESVIRPNKALRQIPFNGKKLRPAKLRKDYWRPMALIQFPEGQGVVGRSVLQKLREFRIRHELSWEDERYYQLSRHRRGIELNDQKPNTVADVAAVLAGAGKGNLIRAAPAPAADPAGLLDVTVFWSDAVDQAHAREWSNNVTHQLGLPPQTKGRGEEVEEEEPGAAAEEMDDPAASPRRGATPA